MAEFLCVNENFDWRFFQTFHPETAKVSYQECDISPAERLDCGYYGIQIEECQSRGCCWKTSEDPAVNWCYHSNSKLKVILLFWIVTVVIQKHIHTHKSCNYFAAEHAVEECVSVGSMREDCGYYGIHSRECTDGGCCWMPTQEQGAPWCFYSGKWSLDFEANLIIYWFDVLSLV